MLARLVISLPTAHVGSERIVDDGESSVSSAATRTTSPSSLSALIAGTWYDW